MEFFSRLQPICVYTKFFDDAVSTYLVLIALLQYKENKHTKFYKQFRQFIFSWWFFLSSSTFIYYVSPFLGFSDPFPPPKYSYCILSLSAFIFYELKIEKKFYFLTPFPLPSTTYIIYEWSLTTFLSEIGTTWCTSFLAIF